jgi:hypothetical protein
MAERRSLDKKIDSKVASKTYERPKLIKYKQLRQIRGGSM